MALFLTDPCPTHVQIPSTPLCPEHLNHAKEYPTPRPRYAHTRRASCVPCGQATGGAVSRITLATVSDADTLADAVLYRLGLQTRRMRSAFHRKLENENAAFIVKATSTGKWHSTPSNSVFC